MVKENKLSKNWDSKYSCNISIRSVEGDADIKCCARIYAITCKIGGKGIAIIGIEMKESENNTGWERKNKNKNINKKTVKKIKIKRTNTTCSYKYYLQLLYKKK